LSVVFQIVAAHGGHICAASALGKGTTFHLFIPAVPVIAKEGVAAPSQEGNPARSLRVLVVEDDEAVANGLHWSLEAEGIEAEVVRTGAEVVLAIARFRPDVMVLDLSLPDEDGWAVYERVSAVSPLPVVFSSGHISQAAIDRLVEASQAVFLMKPYTMSELLAAIQRLLRVRKDAHA
jgi:CheY-like chemotaxis protein